MEFKTCSICHLEKEINFFYRSKNYNGGRMSMCKACFYEYTLEYKRKMRKRGEYLTSALKLASPTKEDYCEMYSFLEKIGYDIHSEKSVHEQFCDKYGLPYKRRALKSQNRFSAEDCL